MAWTTPVDPTSGMTVTTSYFKTYVTDNLKVLGAPWTTYTPAWASSGTQPALGNGTLQGSWLQIGKLILFHCVLTSGSTTTYGTGAYTLTSPTAPTASQRFRIDGWYFDSSGGALYQVLGNMATTTTVNMYSPGAPVAAVSNVAPVTMATGDSIQLNGVYEGA